MSPCLSHLIRPGFAGAIAVFSALALQSASFLSPAEVADALTADQRTAIEQAVPQRASATPRPSRRLLVFDQNVNYGGHPSAAHANYAFTIMGRKTGAFEAVVSRDPSAFERETLRTFDAVFFNNNVGNLFEDPSLRQNLVKFVMEGGGMLGVHGTAVAFTRWPGAHEDWPEFGRMLGARGANHRINNEHAFIQLDDPGHPLNRAFGGKDFDYRDEFFRVHEPYSRSRVRVLFRIDTARTDMNQGQSYGRVEREDQDYALAWIRNYGRGRTFYCTIAHNPYVFSDSLMLTFYLDAIQFALGDLDAPTTPSARLTPAVRAQERLDWQLAADANRMAERTLFDSFERASELGLAFLSASGAHRVSATLPATFNSKLGENERRQIRLKLDDAGLRFLSYRLDRLPDDPEEARQSLAFARGMGAETVILATPPSRLDQAAAWCKELDLRLAIHSANLGTDNLHDLVELCRRSGPRTGIEIDLNELMQQGLDPMATLRPIKDRLFVVRLAPAFTQHDNLPHASDNQPWLKAIRFHEIAPVLFTLDLEATAPAVTRAAFDAISTQLAH